MQFWDPSQWNVFLSIKESIFNAEMGQNFHIHRADRAFHPSPFAANLTIKRLFFSTSLCTKLTLQAFPSSSVVLSCWQPVGTNQLVQRLLIKSCEVFNWLPIDHHMVFNQVNTHQIICFLIWTVRYGWLAHTQVWMMNVWFRFHWNLFRSARTSCITSDWPVCPVR